MNTAATPMINFRYLLTGIVMLVVVGLWVALTPREKVADHGPKLDKETMIPTQFGDWIEDTSNVPLQITRGYPHPLIAGIAFPDGTNPLAAGNTTANNKAPNRAT